NRQQKYSHFACTDRVGERSGKSLFYSTPIPRLLWHPRHLTAPPPHAYRRRRFLHHSLLPSPLCPRRKNSRLPRRAILLARPRPPRRPRPSRPRFAATSTPLAPSFFDLYNRTIMVHTGAMSPANKTVRQSVTLAANIASQVRNLAKTRRLTCTKVNGIRILAHSGFVTAARIPRPSCSEAKPPGASRSSKNLPSSPPSPAFSSHCSSFSLFPVSSASSRVPRPIVSTVPGHWENRCTALAPRSATPPDRTLSDEPSPELPPQGHPRENSPRVCPARSRAASRMGSSQSPLAFPPQCAK